jgi:hypothetical protein
VATVCGDSARTTTARDDGWIDRECAAAAKPLNPRLAALLAFGAAVSQVDCVAPVRGTRRLEDYFAAFAPSET